MRISWSTVSNAFFKSANTNILTDSLFLQKPDSESRKNCWDFFEMVRNIFECPLKSEYGIIFLSDGAYFYHLAILLSYLVPSWIVTIVKKNFTCYVQL